MSTDSFETEGQPETPDWAGAAEIPDLSGGAGPDAEAPQAGSADTDAEVGGRGRRGRKHADTGGRSGGRRRPGALRGTTAEQRKAVERAVAVVALDDGELALLGFAAGLPGADEMTEVALASLGAEERCVAVLSLILGVAQADPMAAGAIAVGAGGEPNGLGAAWAALGHLSTTLPASMPSNPVEAGLAFAAAAQGLPEATPKLLGGLLHLLGSDLDA